MNVTTITDPTADPRAVTIAEKASALTAALITDLDGIFGYTTPATLADTLTGTVEDLHAIRGGLDTLAKLAKVTSSAERLERAGYITATDALDVIRVALGTNEEEDTND